PTSIDRLHAQAKRLMDSDDPAKWDEALDGPLHQFAIHYPNAAGEKADQMRRWNADAQYRQCVEQIKRHKEHKHHFAANDDEEIAAPAAVAEDAGDSDRARKGWKKQKQQGGGAAWGVFATRRLEEMTRAEQEGARLEKALNTPRERHREPAADDPDRE